jgi:hypothetical protein
MHRIRCIVVEVFKVPLGFVHQKRCTTVPVKPRDFYEARAKALIKELRESQDISYKELARRLESFGVHVSDRVLINRINRGAFTFAFALMVLAALGQKSIDIPRLSSLEPKPRQPSPKS